MKQICVASRAEWRSWLAENHDKEMAGIWLVFFKKQADRSSLEYEESVEEALCLSMPHPCHNPGPGTTQ
ncbi:MAG: hypothetical protein ACLQU4_20560 [Limisphaerales bacterium]